MTMPANLAGLFPGLSGGQGGVYMQQVNGGSPLAGEPDVMMISGLGQPEQVTAPPGVSVVGNIAQQPVSLMSQLNQPVTIGQWTRPLWNWLFIAALLGGAGGYYLGRR